MTGSQSNLLLMSCFVILSLKRINFLGKVLYATKREFIAILNHKKSLIFMHINNLSVLMTL